MLNVSKMIVWLLAIMLLASCAPSVPEATVEIPEEADALVKKATKDLADRLDIVPGNVVVESVTETEFRDASLGVPEPGKSYAQVITPGYIIVLRAEGGTYEYHAADNRVVFAPEASSP
ncbi:MAG: hypothetical protein GVY30_12685 [Chloroflexi bacterium]|jgi:hypothetical protein|nr:hypothetical protein [Chloroflexota bacterium]